MKDSPRFVLVTGLSGAGKSQALKFLEDLGFYAVDNLPAPLIQEFADYVVNSDQSRKRIAVCVDARTGKDLKRLPGDLEKVEKLGVRPDVLFLEANDNVLVRRYSESRRRHPSSPNGSIDEGIKIERNLLEPVRERADLVVDTSSIPVAELRERIAGMFLVERSEQDLVITLMSFGFKYGLPHEADIVLDVRFLPNPFYDSELKPWTGNEPAVRDYVLDNDAAYEFLDRIKGLFKFLIPLYLSEPKSYLTIAIGCTGGRHRSVAVSNALLFFLRDMKYDARVRHRDISHVIEETE